MTSKRNRRKKGEDAKTEDQGGPVCGSEERINEAGNFSMCFYASPALRKPNLPSFATLYPSSTTFAPLPYASLLQPLRVSEKGQTRDRETKTREIHRRESVKRGESRNEQRRWNETSKEENEAKRDRKQ
eukprot:5955456-Pleurochrysis_carterae.AAC.9